MFSISSYGILVPSTVNISVSDIELKYLKLSSPARRIMVFAETCTSSMREIARIDFRRVKRGLLIIALSIRKTQHKLGNQSLMS
jgi:hypothetical protein